MKKPAILASLKKRLAASGPGLTVAIIAMIVALAGTAYAATKLNSTQKKEVEKIAKKYAGKTGKTGATGAPGSPGARGPAGPKGDTGTTGNQGLPGTAGKNPEIVEEDPELCGPGTPGVVYEVEGSNEEAEICDGAKGPEGSPWTAGGTLPPGATEKGTWGISWGPQGGGGILGAPISFPIPLFGEIAANHVHIALPIGDPNCKGGSITPNALNPGELCLFETTSSGVLEGSVLPEIVKSDFTTPGADKQGAVLRFEAADESGYWFGAFAVKGCDPVPTNPFPCPS